MGQLTDVRWELRAKFYGDELCARRSSFTPSTCPYKHKSYEARSTRLCFEYTIKLSHCTPVSFAASEAFRISFYSCAAPSQEMIKQVATDPCAEMPYPNSIRSLKSTAGHKFKNMVEVTVTE